MATKDLFSSLFFIFLSIYVCYESIDLGLGRLSRPGSGFSPLIVGILLGVLGVIIFLRAWFKKNSAETIPRLTIPWSPLLLVYVCCMAFALSMEILGFNIATFFFIGILLRAVEKKSWTLSVLTALSVTLGAYILFQFLLRSQLPSGLLGFR